MLKGNPVSGAAYLLRGLGLIAEPRLRRFVVIPLAINILLFGALVAVAADQFVDLLKQLLPEWLDWLRWLLWPLFAISILLVLFYTFTLVANFIAAPFNGLLAEAVERHLTGRPLPSGTFTEALKMAPRAFAAEGKKLVYLLMWSVPLLILFIVPGLNVLAPFLWLAFSAWMMSLEYADYPMSNHGLLFPAPKVKLAEKRLTALGFGGAVMVMTAVPVLNFLAMPTAVAGATALWVREWREG